MLEFQCCFCGETVSDANRGSAGLDPCALIVVANWSMPLEKQKEQQFFCHLDCFRRALGDQSGNLEIADPDFPAREDTDDSPGPGWWRRLFTKAGG